MNRTLFLVAAGLLLINSSSAADGDSSPPLLSVSGTVGGPDGKAIAGATVYLREWAYLRKGQPPQETVTPDILATTTTDANGRFTFRDVSAKKPSIAVPGGPLAAPWDVIVVAKGFGLAWERLEPRSPHPALRVNLPTEARIGGRLFDAKGKPVEGVQVQAVALQPLNRPARVPYYTAGSLSLHGSQVPLAARSDADGRFVLPGLPGNRRLALEVVDKRFARQTFYAATTDQPQPDVVLGRVFTPDGGVAVQREPVHTGAFSLTLQPAHQLRVRVVFEDTAKPSAGALLREIEGPTRLPETKAADIRGEFSLGQLATGKYTLTVAAPPRADYLGRIVQVDVPPDELELDEVIGLPAGAVITGQVVEEETGKGIPGVPLSHHPSAAKGTDNRTFTSPVRTGPDGHFRMAVPPGKGWLRITAPVSGYVTTELSNPSLREKEGRLVRAVDATLEKPVSGMKFILSRGLVVTFVLRDLGGKPVSGAQIWGHGSPSDVDGKITLTGLDPQQRHELVIAHPFRPLAGRIAVPPSLDNKILQQEVKLQPTGSIAGRVLDEANQPIRGAAVQVLEWSLVRKGEKKLYATSVAATLASDAEGRYVLDRLPAGFSYSAKVTVGGYTSANGLPLEMQPGSLQNFPDIILSKADQSIAGVVVDPQGHPLSGVRIMGSFLRGEDTESGIRLSSSGQATTDEEGRFRMTGLPKGLIRMTAMRLLESLSEGVLQPPASFQLWAGNQDVKLILSEPKPAVASETMLGKPAPPFAVRQWLGQPNAQADRAFNVKDFAGQVVLLAFLDEAKPSERMLSALNKLNAKRGDRTLAIVRVYEQSGSKQVLGKEGSTPAALVAPGLLPGGFSQAFQAYGVRATPTLFVIDRQGGLRFADVDLDVLEARVEELFK